MLQSLRVCALGLLGSLLFAVPLFAQSREVQFYQPGVDPTVGVPFTTLSLPMEVECAPAPIPDVSISVVNPRRIGWPGDVPGTLCIADAETFLTAFPTGGPYRATMTITMAGTVSPRSAASNFFTTQASPAAPPAPRLLRP
jgi:hypothetical protein